MANTVDDLPLLDEEDISTFTALCAPAFRFGGLVREALDRRQTQGKFDLFVFKQMQAALTWAPVHTCPHLNAGAQGVVIMEYARSCRSG